MIEINNKKLCESCFEEVEGEGICPHCGFSKEEFSPDAMVLPLGTKLNDKIIIGRVMGKGGFGVTYLGYDLRMEKTIAVKEYYPNGIAYRSQSGTEVLVADPKSNETFDKGTEKFYTEAEMVAQFNGNPNIVGVYDYFRANNTVYLIMEYLNGITLKNYVKKRGKITDGQALYVMDKMAAALSITHSAGVLHRDISPDNIMVCLDGKVKLIDFGAARQIVAESSSNLTVVMKPGYTPIEQYTKKGKQGAWTDIYALGASIYYAMTGKIIDDPYERMENDSEFTSNLHKINDSLWNVIKKCTMINASDRYGNAIELRKALSTVSAPIKAEPIVLEAEDVKLTSQDEEKEKEKEDVKGFLAASLLNSQEPIELFASKELEGEGVEEYEQPAVPEGEGYKAGEDVYSKTEDKKKPSKKLLFGIIGGAAGALIAALAIVLVLTLPKSMPTGNDVGGDVSDGSGGYGSYGNDYVYKSVYIDYEDVQWAKNHTIPSDTLKKLGGDVRITLELGTSNNTDAIFNHTEFRHTLSFMSAAGYHEISADNGRVDESGRKYDVYEGQKTFVFTVTKAEIDSMEGDLNFMPNNIELYSATIETFPGVGDDARTVEFTEDVPVGEWNRYLTSLSKKGLLGFEGDVRVEVECVFKPGVLLNNSEVYIKTIDENWDPVIVDVPNMAPDDGETVYNLSSEMLGQNKNTFVFIISRELIEGLTDKGLGFQVNNLQINKVTLRSPLYSINDDDGGSVSSGSDVESQKTVLADFPSEYAGDWKDVGTIPKDKLMELGGDVRITFDITSGLFCEEREPYFYLNLGQPDGSGLVSKDVYGVRRVNEDAGVGGICYGMTEYVIEVSRHEIEELSGDVWIATHNIIVNSVTLEDAETAAANDEVPGTRTEPTVFEYPGEYLEAGWIAAALPKYDLAAYGTDVKITLELEGGDFNENTDFAGLHTILFRYDAGDEGWPEATDLLTTADHKAMTTTFVDVDEGDSVVVFYMTKENIEKLHTVMLIEVNNTIVKKVTVTPVVTVDVSDSYPGDWQDCGSVGLEDVQQYFTDDAKVTLQLEYINNTTEHSDWLDCEIYNRNLNLHDKLWNDVPCYAFNKGSDTEGKKSDFSFGWYVAEFSNENGATFPFEFVLTREDMAEITEGISFTVKNILVRSASFEAYDPREDALSENAVAMDLSAVPITWGERTSAISKELLESIGGDVKMTLDISGDRNVNDIDVGFIFPVGVNGNELTLYSRNHGFPEDHAYIDKYQTCSGYTVGHYKCLPEQFQFVITKEQIQELYSEGMYFNVQGLHITKVHLEPA